MTRPRCLFTDPPRATPQRQNRSPLSESLKKRIAEYLEVGVHPSDIAFSLGCTRQQIDHFRRSLK